MAAAVLNALKSDDLAIDAVAFSTPVSLRRFLSQREEIAAARTALHQGAITEESIRRFVSELMEGFHRGEHFPHEEALAALCLVLEKRPTDFAEEYLRDLARLRLAEMGLAIRVARECVMRRARGIHNESRKLSRPLDLTGLSVTERSDYSSGRRFYHETNGLEVLPC